MAAETLPPKAIGDPARNAVKKRKRRQTPAQLCASAIKSLTAVELANALPPLEFSEKYIEPFQTLLEYTSSKEKDSTPFLISHVASGNLTESEFTACFDIIASTSLDAYKMSSRGWKPQAKKEEMKEKDVKYLLVRKNSCTGGMVSNTPGPSKSEHAPNGTHQESEIHDILGFLSFMITIEDSYPVLYVYEIHLLPEIQSHGLGSHLISLAEKIAEKVGMVKTMLTVFTSNVAGERFYRRLGFVEDEFGPQPKRLRGGVVKKPDYLILSKRVGTEQEL